MPKIECPECGERFQPREHGKPLRCPMCRARINRDDDDAEEIDDYEVRKPRKKRRKQSIEPAHYRGLVAALVLVPIALAIGIAAPLPSVGTQLAIWCGFGIWIIGLVFLKRVYGDPSDGTPVEAHNLVMMFHAIGASFKYPRLLASWTIVHWVGIALIFDGVLSAIFLKTLQEKPANPNAQQVQNANPGVPAAQPSDDQAISEALALMDKTDDYDRERGAGKLTLLAPKPDRREEVVRKLRERVDSKHRMTRVNCIKALGLWGDWNDGLLIIPFLDHEDLLTRQATVVALGKIHDERAIPALIKHMNDGGCSGESVAALSSFGPPVEKDMIPLISPKDPIVMETAIGVVKIVGTAASIPALRKIVQSKHFDAPQAAAAIREINARRKQGAK